MLYAFLKFIGRPAIRIFCRKIVVNNPDCFRQEGPILIASNHPNSFLDAVILDLFFRAPVYSLARGDAFLGPLISRILRALKILPVYRTSEGVENLGGNYETFDACTALFRERNLVLMFSEGKCINEWHLRPLKKGTARLAFKSLENGIPLRVLPVGLNYSSFDRIGKIVVIHLGKMILPGDINMELPEGLRYRIFNDRLRAELEQGVFEIGKTNTMGHALHFSWQPPWPERLLLAAPALFGWFIHAPLYLPVKWFVTKKYRNTEHYDSVLFGILLLSYPLYLFMLVVVTGWWFAGWFALLLLPLLPFSAWACTRLSPQAGR